MLWFNDKQRFKNVEVSSNKVCFKRKQQHFLKCDSDSIKMQINNVFFSAFFSEISAWL